MLAASSGEEAIARWGGGQTSLHGVVTDGIMAGADGFGVARHFAQFHPPVPAILISGYLTHFVSRRDLPPNLTTFLSKPLSRDEFLAAVLALAAFPGAEASAVSAARIRPS